MPPERLLMMLNSLFMRIQLIKYQTLSPKFIISTQGLLGANSGRSITQPAEAAP